VSGAAPLASPSFTGTPKSDTFFEIEGADNALLTLDETNGVAGGAQSTYISMQAGGTQTAYLGIASSGGIMYTANKYGPIQFMTGPSGTEFSRFILEDTNQAVFNEIGANYDFRVESDGNTHMLFVDASENAVAIGSASTSTASRLRAAAATVTSGDSIVLIDSANDANVAGNHLRITSLRGDTSAYNLLTIDNVAGEILNISGNGSVVFNEAGLDRGFRVETSNNPNMFYVNGGNDSVVIGNTSADSYMSLAIHDDKTFGSPATNSTAWNSNDGAHGQIFIDSGNNGMAISLDSAINARKAYLQVGHASTAYGAITDGRIYLQPFGGTVYMAGGEGGVNQRHLFSDTGAVINQSGEDLDFRVESDGRTHMLFVDASENKLTVGGNTPTSGNTFNVIANEPIRLESSSSSSYYTEIGTSYDYNKSFVLEHKSHTLMEFSDGTGLRIRGNKADGYGRVQIWGDSGSATGRTGVGLTVETGGVVINEGGQDKDFRVESDNQTHMLYVDAGSNSVGIKTSATDAALNVNAQSTSTDVVRLTGSGGNNFIQMVGNQGQTAIRMWENGANDPGYTSWYNQGTEQHKIQSGANETVTFNEQGLDLDFVVESNSNANMLKVDGGNNSVGIGTGSPNSAYGLHIEGAKRAALLKKTSSGDGDLMQEITWDTSGYSTKLYVCASGAGPNGAATGLYIGRNNSTNRSINAAGTINASGSDYAEYMVKADTSATINKGDVCGIDVNGNLTTVWADAISFVVKSTEPSYVGGDVWFNNEERPERDDVTAEEYAAFEARLEAARATVDRIAFSGQVPVNVTGATVGDYIVPLQDGTGITGQAVSNPTFDQYMAAVGKVIAIEDDGRAKIIVKVA
jgi:hypothetical protein